MRLIKIGTHSTNDIVYDKQGNPKYEYISGHHAEIMINDDGAIYVTDKGSSNGTVVKGQTIRPETDVIINRGDKVVFGGVAVLDWSRIPEIRPPQPGWKLYNIGTDYKNRVQIVDTSNYVSRFHATLKIDPKGKMFINDHSANGTYVNGERIPAHQDISVRKKDRIMFANLHALNWNSISSGSSFNLPVIAAIVAAMLIIAYGIGAYMTGMPPFANKMTSKEAMQATALVYHKYYYEVELIQGLKEIGNKLILGQDNNGLPCLVVDDNVHPFALFGTAFFISNDGKMVTNKHVAAPWDFVNIEQNKEDFYAIEVYTQLLVDSYSKLIAQYPNINKKVLLSELNKILSSIMPSMKGQMEVKYNEISAKQNIKSLKGNTITMSVGYYDKYYDSFEKFESCQSLKVSPDNAIDLGIIQLSEKRNPIWLKKIFELGRVDKADMNLKVGDKIKTIGYPRGVSDLTYRPEAGGLKPIWKEGNIQRDPSSIKIDLNLVVQGGASGSPIVNEKMQLVGVIDAGWEKGSNSQGILAKHIKKLLDETN